MNMKKMFVLVLGVLLIASSCSKKKMLKVTGSETMFPMMQILADDFKRSQDQIGLEVKGGGSKYGISQLLAGKTDIAMTSNSVEGTIIDKLADSSFEELAIAYDGIAIVVNKNNSLKKVTLSQLSDIFSGKIKNFSEIGGPDLPIHPVIRNDYSGTAAFMKKHILRKLDLSLKEYDQNKDLEYVKQAIIAKDNQNMTKIIEKTPGGIGYMGMVCAGIDIEKAKMKTLAYAVQESDPFVLPSVKNVHSGLYKLARPLKIVYQPGNSMIDTFVSYALSERGQNRIVAAGHLRTSRETIEVRAKKGQSDKNN